MGDIKSMGLYRNVERILADLAASGLGEGDPVTVDDLTPFDQYHYEGTSAVDDACAFLRPSPRTRILDIGSGLGGPARYIADRTGSRVTALEIQTDLHETATSLSARCGLDHLVDHVNGDVLDGLAGSGRFDGIVSMLCFLHIPHRETLFARCAQALVPGGALFVDDYYEKAPLTTGERDDLAQKVFCPYVPDLDRYVVDVEAAGFSAVSTVDKTADWTEFVTGRLARFRAARSDLLDRYGAETVDGLDDFYTTVATLFGNGHLGGLRLTARLG